MKKIKELAKICRMTQPQLLNWLSVEMTKYYKTRKIKQTEDYLYIKGQLPICFVAHLDTVHKEVPKDIYYSLESNVIFSPEGIGGDDRCGVYIILELLKRGFRPSIIFCCDEEVGCIGAGKFTKAYETINNVNWFLEFDRRGSNDVVCYDDDNDELTKVFESYGFKSQWGSYTDICELAPHFKISGVNVSSGYYNPHTKNEYIDLNDVEWVIETVEKVLQSDYINVKYEYMEPYTYESYLGDKTENYYKTLTTKFVCEMCGTVSSNLKDTTFGNLCDDCIRQYDLKWCENCGKYTWEHTDGTCDECGLPVKEDSKDD